MLFALRSAHLLRKEETEDVRRWTLCDAASFTHVIRGSGRVPARNSEDLSQMRLRDSLSATRVA